jgi:transcriptional regulator with XRE-family HTH domain
MQGVVGAKLRKARTELGLSQAAFARAGHSDQVPGT